MYAIIYQSQDRFLPNKYTKLYFSIIQSRIQSPLEGYTERHHILPKKLGGLKVPSNLIILSAREHFICHRLLTKRTTGNERINMIFAAYALAYYRCPSRGLIKVSGKTYEKLKKDLAIARKSSPGHNKGKVWTKEQRASMKNKTDGTILFHRGRERSVETREKIKEKRALQVIKKKTWTLKDPTGNIIETQGLKNFCIEHKLGLSKLVETEYTKQPVNNGFSKGWMIISIVRN